MLTRAVLLPAAVAVLLLSSACFGGDDDDGDTVPTETPGAATNTPTNQVAGESTPGGSTPDSASPTPSGPQTHTVQAGEFLSTIAEQYGVTVDEILAANDIADANLIFPGQELTIPEPGSTPADGTAQADDGAGEDTTPTEEATAEGD